MHDEKRAYLRFGVQLPAKYKINDFSPACGVTVVDVGAEGMRFLSEELFDIGQVIELELCLEQAVVSFKVAIMWLAKTDQKQYNVGVKIVDARRNDEIKFIHFYCEKMMSFSKDYKKILLIDDEKDMVRLLQIELEKENYSIICAYDGEEGFSKYLDEKPDLIILDVAMPKMSGQYLCKKIRREKKDGQTPILMLTAKNEDSDKIIGRVAGANKYMTKPFDMQLLLETVKGLLHESNA